MNELHAFLTSFFKKVGAGPESSKGTKNVTIANMTLGHVSSLIFE